MSSMSGLELLLIVVIGLVVLGPKRLNELANQIGGWVGQARRMTRSMKRQLEDELNFDDDFKSKPPRIAPPPVASGTPDPTNPAYTYEDEPEPEPHIPNDDDTFSPIHEDEEDDAGEADKADKEKKV